MFGLALDPPDRRSCPRSACSAIGLPGASRRLTIGPLHPYPSGLARSRPRPEKLFASEHQWLRRPSRPKQTEVGPPLEVANETATPCRAGRLSVPLDVGHWGARMRVGPVARPEVVAAKEGLGSAVDEEYLPGHGTVVDGSEPVDQ
jgi:hypothetical protein